MPDLACRYFSDSFWRYVSSLHNGTIYRKHPTTALQERGQWDITEEVWWIMCNPVGDRDIGLRCRKLRPASPPNFYGHDFLPHI